MSIFGVKNVLCQKIVNQDIFFNTSEKIYDYLTIQNPNFLLQHLMVFAPNTDAKIEACICNCTACLHLIFEKCLQSSEELYQKQTSKYGKEEYNDDV